MIVTHKQLTDHFRPGLRIGSSARVDGWGSTAQNNAKNCLRELPHLSRAGRHLLIGRDDSRRTALGRRRRSRASARFDNISSRSRLVALCDRYALPPYLRVAPKAIVMP